MAFIGNTIIIRAEFHDAKTNELCNPTSIKLKLYDGLYRQIGESLEVTSKVEEGIYEYTLVIPDGRGDLYYEISSEIEGNPVVARGKIDRKWS